MNKSQHSLLKVFICQVAIVSRSLMEQHNILLNLTIEQVERLMFIIKSQYCVSQYVLMPIVPKLADPTFGGQINLSNFTI